MKRDGRTLRNGISCVLVFLACYVVAWPVAQMGFVDDWSYVKVAQVFAATGRVAYNGWPVETLGWMIPWGALFIKMFGFSFMAVKVSTLPVAVGTLLLFHSVLRRFEIGAWNAVIGTLTLGLSPLFLPLSASFMTDIPGLFAIVLCLYLCQRAIAAATDKAAIGWLVLAAVSNMVTGTARQVAWLGVLVMVPCTGWLLRKRRGVLGAALGLWIAGIGAVFYCMHWFKEQPYSVTVTNVSFRSFSPAALIGNSMLTVDLMMAQMICLLLIVFPVLVAWLPRFGRKFDHYVSLFLFGLLPMLIMEALLRGGAEIWPPHVLFKELSVQKDARMVWFRDAHTMLIPPVAQILISLVLIAALIGCIHAVRNKGWERISGVEPERARVLFWLLVPFSLSYFAILLPLAWNTISFDRYMLGVMPFAIVGLIWLYERYMGPRLPQATVALLALFALVSVAGTHDWFAWQRARLAAIHELRAAGIPRTKIEGGFEYDGWTQVTDGGYIHNPLIRIPAGAVDPNVALKISGDPCVYSFLQEVPDVQPEYSVAIGARRCNQRSRFPAVHYTAWIPPFRRTVYVEKIGGNGR